MVNTSGSHGMGRFASAIGGGVSKPSFSGNYKEPQPGFGQSAKFSMKTYIGDGKKFQGSDIDSGSAHEDEKPVLGSASTGSQEEETQKN